MASVFDKEISNRNSGNSETWNFIFGSGNSNEFTARRNNANVPLIRIKTEKSSDTRANVSRAMQDDCVN